MMPCGIPVRSIATRSGLVEVGVEYAADVGDARVEDWGEAPLVSRVVVVGEELRATGGGLRASSLLHQRDHHFVDEGRRRRENLFMVLPGSAMGTSYGFSSRTLTDGGARRAPDAYGRRRVVHTGRELARAGEFRDGNLNRYGVAVEPGRTVYTRGRGRVRYQMVASEGPQSPEVENRPDVHVEAVGGVGRRRPSRRSRSVYTAFGNMSAS